MTTELDAAVQVCAVSDRWQQKPEFDKLGCKLVCVLIENLPDQVEEFKKDFWPGDLYLDTDKAFFAAVGGGKVRGR